MEIKEVADVVRALHRAVGDKAHPCGKAVFLIGAGCSRSAGIPVGAEIVDLCAIKLAKAYHGPDFGEDEADAAIALLIEKGDLPEGSKRESLYGYLFERHFPDATDQQEIVQEAVRRCTGINWAHLCLGELVDRQYVHTVLTTNFDQLVLEGVIRTGQIPVIADGVESLNPPRRKSSTCTAPCTPTTPATAPKQCPKPRVIPPCRRRSTHSSSSADLWW